MNHLERLAIYNGITLAALFGELAGMAPYFEAKVTQEKPLTAEPVQVREPVFHDERKKELEDLEQQQETAEDRRRAAHLGVVESQLFSWELLCDRARKHLVRCQNRP